MAATNTSDGDNVPVHGNVSAAPRTSTRSPTPLQVLWQWISTCVALLTAADASTNPNVRVARNAEPLIGSSPPRTFRELCQAIARNDPCAMVVSTSPNADIHFPPNGVKALGRALLKGGNSTIASMELHVWNLLSDFGRNMTSLCNGAISLLEWLKHAPPSLESVYVTVLGFRVYHDKVADILMKGILQAMISIPNLKTLRVDLQQKYLPALTDYLTKSPTAWRTLQSMHLGVSGNVLDRDRDVRATAQAIGALHGLKYLTLEIHQGVAEPFLWALSQSSPLMIQEVRLIFPEGTTVYSGTAEALASFLTYSTQLQSVEIFHFSCSYNRVFTMIATALRTNPTIHSFGLYNAILSNDAATAFLNGMQSHQHAIRKLQLTNCQFRMHPQTTGVDFANMLCGSMLEYIVLDHGVVSPRQIASFFAVLSVNASTVRLRSMVLELLFDITMMHPVEHVAPFVASTIRLESLTICICSNRSSDDDLLLSVPVTALVTSMKSNASLCEVKVIRKRDQQPAIRADAWRRIEAFAMRNRMLQPGLANMPRELLQNCKGRPVLLALCQVAMQTTHRTDHEKVAMVMSFLATM